MLTGEHVDHAAENQDLGRRHAIMARNIFTQSQQNRREGNNEDQQSAVRCLLQLVKRVHAIALRLSGLMLWMTNPCWSCAAEELEKSTDQDVLKWDSTEKGSKGEQHLARAKGKRTHQSFRESTCLSRQIKTRGKKRTYDECQLGISSEVQRTQWEEIFPEPENEEKPVNRRSGEMIMPTSSKEYLREGHQRYNAAMPSFMANV